MVGREAACLGAGIVAPCAGQAHKCPYLIEREAELARPPNETQPRNVVGIVTAKAATWPVRRRQ